MKLQELLVLTLVGNCCPLAAYSHYYSASPESVFFVQKHPQEFFCEADFALVGKVLSKTTSSLSLQNTHHVSGYAVSSRSSGLRPPPTNTTVLLVRVKRLFKGAHLAKEGNTVALVTSRIKTDLRVTIRRSYVFTGFIHLAHVPVDYGHCSSLLRMGRHVFVENQLNFMWGCSWFQHRSSLTSEQKQGLAGVYDKGCRHCQIVRCHGRPDDPQRYCLGDLEGALFGKGCVMHLRNEIMTARQMTCSRSCHDKTCKWMMCSSARASCRQQATPTAPAVNESVTPTSTLVQPCRDSC